MATPIGVCPSKSADPEPAPPATVLMSPGAARDAGAVAESKSNAPSRESVRAQVVGVLMVGGSEGRPRAEQVSGQEAPRAKWPTWLLYRPACGRPGCSAGPHSERGRRTPGSRRAADDTFHHARKPEFVKDG